ncbi:LysE family translocator [Actinoallomurus sp. NBC_01490]|uniref:LysE family translocator n=1 Tax=Actinoallomurus sp. NBC_01490 TaxID=2903557 RepID=UPI002E34B73A|nr:LysE family translocator [Actinoallomurus sp. NBC_01490]
MIASFLTFLGVSALVIVTPGPDTAVTVSGTLGGGRRGGVSTALGVFCGQALWTLATSAGISALLVASAPAFLTVKYLGAAYLLYLGLHAIWSAVLHRSSRQAAVSEPAQRRSPLACYRRGLLSDLGNPKMAVFFTSLLPQFGTHFVVLTLLGLVFCSMTFLWLAGYAVAIAKMGDLLRRSAVRRALDAVTGTVLLALGVRLATEQR